jgi:uncharacterized protein (DUF849 family)
MSNPCIITVAITGALPTKQDTPAVPVTPSEQIESTHEAFEAGASLVHIHVRNPDQTPSSDPDKYHEVNQWCLELGGHCRTGLEDNIKITPDRLAASNAELVAKIVDIAGEYNRHPASPTEARKILGLKIAAENT